MNDSFEYTSLEDVDAAALSAGLAASTDCSRSANVIFFTSFTKPGAPPAAADGFASDVCAVAAGLDDDDEVVAVSSFLESLPLSFFASIFIFSSIAFRSLAPASSLLSLVNAGVAAAAAAFVLSVAEAASAEAAAEAFLAPPVRSITLPSLSCFHEKRFQKES